MHNYTPLRPHEDQLRDDHIDPGDAIHPQIRDQENDHQRTTDHYTEVQHTSSHDVQLGRPLLQPSKSATSVTSDQSGIPLMPLRHESTRLRISQNGSDNPKLGSFTRLWRQYSGWRFGVLASAVAASITCAINIALTIWLSATYSPKDGIGTAFTGACDSVSRVALAVHLVINILGSIMLAASNYCMQCLAAPTREECDRAHSRHNSLDIGINSIRNLLYVRKWRSVLWILLSVSSLPIHLVYNSTFFKVLAANEYAFLEVNPAFFSSDLVWNSTDGCSVNVSQTVAENKSWTCDNYALGPYVNSTCHVLDCSLPRDISTSSLAHTLREITLGCQGSAQCLRTLSNGSIVPLDLSNDHDHELLWASCRLSDCSLIVGKTTNPHPTFAEIITASMIQASAFNDDLQSRTRFLEHKDAYHNRTWAECVTDYSSEYVTDWGDIFLVTNYKDPNMSSHWSDVPQVSNFVTLGGQVSFHQQNPPYDWLCDLTLVGTSSEYCTTQNILKSDHQGFDYCIAESTNAFCKLQFSITMLVIVIVCNVLKAACMFCAFAYQRDAPFVVTGDALASYLRTADSLTKGRCLSTIKMVRNGRTARTTATHESLAIKPALYEATKPALYKAISPGQFWYSLLFIMAFLLTSLALFSMAIEAATQTFGDIQAVWALGVGVASPQLVLSNYTIDPTSATAFVAAVVVSNLPQLVLSIAYLLYNNYFTIMLQHKEWSAYALMPKMLRVSVPKGKQRSTYFLHVPYKYGAPLLAASTILHWLVSQSLFLLRIDLYFRQEEDVNGRITAIGYSPLAILLSLVLGISMLCVAAGMGLTHAKSAMPIAASNSFTIAASCHTIDDINAALKPIQWGETEESTKEEIGHCAFTSLSVSNPKSGRLYQ